MRARVAGSTWPRDLPAFRRLGNPLFQRPHHLARTFAREGYVAVFDCSNAHDDVNGFKEIEPNLFLFRGPDGVLQRAGRSRCSGRSPTTTTQRDALSVVRARRSTTGSTTSPSSRTSAQLLERTTRERSGRGDGGRERGREAARAGARRAARRDLSPQRRRVRALRRTATRRSRRTGSSRAFRASGTPHRRLLRRARRVVRLRSPRRTVARARPTGTSS